MNPQPNHKMYDHPHNGIRRDALPPLKPPQHRYHQTHMHNNTNLQTTMSRPHVFPKPPHKIPHTSQITIHPKQHPSLNTLFPHTTQTHHTLLSLHTTYYTTFPTPPSSNTQLLQPNQKPPFKTILPLFHKHPTLPFPHRHHTIPGFHSFSRYYPLIQVAAYVRQGSLGFEKLGSCTDATSPARERRPRQVVIGEPIVEQRDNRLPFLQVISVRSVHGGGSELPWQLPVVGNCLGWLLGGPRWVL